MDEQVDLGDRPVQLDRALLLLAEPRHLRERLGVVAAHRVLRERGLPEQLGELLRAPLPGEPVADADLHPLRVEAAGGERVEHLLEHLLAAVVRHRRHREREVVDQDPDLSSRRAAGSPATPPPPETRAPGRPPASRRAARGPAGSPSAARASPTSDVRTSNPDITSVFAMAARIAEPAAGWEKSVHQEQAGETEPHLGARNCLLQSKSRSATPKDHEPGQPLLPHQARRTARRTARDRLGVPPLLLPEPDGPAGPRGARAARAGHRRAALGGPRAGARVRQHELDGEPAQDAPVGHRRRLRRGPERRRQGARDLQERPTSPRTRARSARSSRATSSTSSSRSTRPARSTASW